MFAGAKPNLASAHARWLRGGTFLDQRGLKHDPLDKYVPAYWREVTWKRFTDEMMPGLLHDPLELRQRYFAANVQMVGAQHRAGVPFVAGTDTAPGVYIVPGFSLHDELAFSSKPDFPRWNRCRQRPAMRQSF